MPSLSSPLKLLIGAGLLLSAAGGGYSLLGGDNQVASGEVTGAIQPSPTVSEQIAQAVLGGMLSCMSGPERFATGALERCGAEAKEKALAIGGREDEINQMIADVSSQLSERLHLSAPVAERLDAMQELHLVDTVRDSLRSCARERALSYGKCLHRAGARRSRPGGIQRSLGRYRGGASPRRVAGGGGKARRGTAIASRADKGLSTTTLQSPPCPCRGGDSLPQCGEVPRLEGVAPPRACFCGIVSRRTEGDSAVSALQLSINKYPRTRHLEGSNLQIGDEDDRVPYRELSGRYIVVEEKVDGANSAFSFSGDAELLLQSRGHYLIGGGREVHFDAFKSWARYHQDAFFDVIEDRYVVYGEWMHSKHSTFYDRLPHYFLCFCAYDRVLAKWLSTAARRALLGKLPIYHVPVLYAGIAPRRLADLTALIAMSRFKSRQWRDVFKQTVEALNLDWGRAWAQTEDSDLAEGLYIKVEEGDYAVITDCP